MAASYGGFIQVKTDNELHDNRNMRRRSLLQTVFGSSVLLSGWSVVTISSDQLSSDLSTELTILSQQPEKPINNKPIITTDKEENSVIITGKMWQGGPCEEVKLTDVSLDQASDELRITVASVQKNTPAWMTSCQTSLGAVQYRLVVSFNTDFPTTAKVTEQPPDGFEAQTTVTTLG